MLKKIIDTGKNKPDLLLHLLMTCIGGYLGAYALLLRGGNFGNAQTGNLLEMMLDIVEGGWRDLLIRLGAMGLFAVALVLSSLLQNHTAAPMAKLCIGVDGLGAVAAALIPASAHPVVALYPVFFLTAFQWGTFCGAEGYGCATIFSTNNLRQVVTGWTEWFATKDPAQRRKAMFYTATVATFLLGGLAGGFLAAGMGTVASLGIFLPLILAWIMDQTR
jgi:uncharacterized membrane protein YoaK (UPF0700 family)